MFLVKEEKYQCQKFGTTLVSQRILSTEQCTHIIPSFLYLPIVNNNAMHTEGREEESQIVIFYFVMCIYKNIYKYIYKSALDLYCSGR